MFVFLPCPFLFTSCSFSVFLRSINIKSNAHDSDEFHVPMARSAWFSAVKSKICCGSACFWFYSNPLEKISTHHFIPLHLGRRTAKERQRSASDTTQRKKNWTIFNAWTIEWPSNLYDSISWRHGMDMLWTVCGFRRSLAIVRFYSRCANIGYFLFVELFLLSSLLSFLRWFFYLFHF